MTKQPFFSLQVSYNLQSKLSISFLLKKLIAFDLQLETLLN